MHSYNIKPHDITNAAKNIEENSTLDNDFKALTAPRLSSSSVADETLSQSRSIYEKKPRYMRR